MYGFDFEKYKNEKMGSLRKYVKEMQKSNPTQKNKGKLEEIGTGDKMPTTKIEHDDHNESNSTHEAH